MSPFESGESRYAPSIFERLGRIALWIIGAGVIVTICLVIFVFAVGGYFGLRAASDVAKVQEQTATPQQEPAANQARLWRVGQSIHVGYWTYRINGFRWLNYLSDGFSFDSVEQPDGKYLAVNLTLRNDDQSPSTMPPIELVDEQGRTSQQSGDGALQPDVFSALKTMNPGVESTGWVIFDVAPGHHYDVLLPGGYESSDKARVELPDQQIAANKPTAASSYDYGSPAATPSDPSAPATPAPAQFPAAAVAAAAQQSYCLVAIHRDTGWAYAWRSDDPRCQAQPAYLKQSGEGVTEAAAMQDYVSKVAAADTNHDIEKVADGH